MRRIVVPSCRSGRMARRSSRAALTSSIAPSRTPRGPRPRSGQPGTRFVSGVNASTAGRIREQERVRRENLPEQRCRDRPRFPAPHGSLPPPHYGVPPPWSRVLRVPISVHVVDDHPWRRPIAAAPPIGDSVRGGAGRSLRRHAPCRPARCGPFMVRAVRTDPHRGGPGRCRAHPSPPTRPRSATSGSPPSPRDGRARRSSPTPCGPRCRAGSSPGCWTRPPCWP